MTEQPGPEQDVSSSGTGSRSLRELAVFFLRLGTVSFGGPAAHIAMMEDELVRRRAWLSREKFLDLLGASNLIPGPSSSELAIHIGYLSAGFPGLLLAGVCFILPASCMVAALAWVYVHFGRLPAVAAVLYGIKPVVIAVVLQALWGLGRTAIKSTTLAIVAVIAAAVGFMGLHPLLLLLAAGIAVVLATQIRRNTTKHNVMSWASMGSAARWPSPRSLLAAAAASVAPFSLGSLFLVFLKTGAVVFGSGYVLLAFLRADLVVHRGWLTNGQLLDSIAVGQITPGPVFTTATFIGYLLGGFPGAVVATAGIFLPGFLLVAASGPFIPRIRKSKIASAFLDGVNAGSLALMAVVSWQLGRTSIIDWPTASLALISAIALFRFRVNSAWLVLMGAVGGLVIRGVTQ
ncbi:MAG: chromate transporter [Acidobacteriia bacterium]|nr:chromate transporter [Terriglobia bacterium]